MANKVTKNNADPILDGFKKQAMSGRKDVDDIAQQVWKHPLLAGNTAGQKRFNAIYETATKKKFKPIK